MASCPQDSAEPGLSATLARAASIAAATAGSTPVRSTAGGCCSPFGRTKCQVANPTATTVNPAAISQSGWRVPVDRFSFGNSNTELNLPLLCWNQTIVQSGTNGTDGTDDQSVPL